VLAAGRMADGHAVSGVRTSDDPVRDTWRGAELKAPGARGTLGRRAAPQLAHGPNGEAGAARERCARGARRRGVAQHGVDRLEHISQYPCSDTEISKNLNRSAQSGE
jgi:hypothetical protein